MTQLKVIDPDVAFFADHPDRYARIRLPGKGPAINAQRAVRIVEELSGEFFSLGDHDKSRRRVLIWRVPRGNKHFDPRAPRLLKIPFLAFADEEIADCDEILLPIIHEIMQDAARKHGLG
jgi:hypothetical protein